MVFEFKRDEYIPQKMIFANEGIYFYSPYSKNLLLLKENKEKKIIESEQKINLATEVGGEILFFAKPSQILEVAENKLNQLAVLTEPYPDFSLDELASFNANFYFLDKKAGQIIKYPYLGNNAWGKADLWLKKTIAGDSISVDGSVWVLEKNEIARYYAGNLQEKIELDIFPSPKEFSKILTSSALPYLYILEPVQKRIIIVNKAGQIIKQFQSEKFDNLLDFTISENGKTIWLLNGLKMYKLAI